MNTRLTRAEEDLEILRIRQRYVQEYNIRRDRGASHADAIAILNAYFIRESTSGVIPQAINTSYWYSELMRWAQLDRERRELRATRARPRNPRPNQWPGNMLTVPRGATENTIVTDFIQEIDNALLTNLDIDGNIETEAETVRRERLIAAEGRYRESIPISLQPRYANNNSATATRGPGDETQCRPLYQELLRRSSVNWGEAPRYTEEYRKIRWAWNGPSQKPIWLVDLRYQRQMKESGTFNRGTTRVGSRRIWNNKEHTRAQLFKDLKFCMRQNIPFKTRTIEYKPSDTSVYVYGIKRLTLDLNTGYISNFSYNGHYDKFVSLFFRQFGIQVFKERDGLWMSYTGASAELGIARTRKVERNRDVEIDLNAQYYLRESTAFLLNENIAKELEFRRHNISVREQEEQRIGNG